VALYKPDSSVNQKLTKKRITFHCLVSKRHLTLILWVQPLIIFVFLKSMYSTCTILC